MPGGYRPPPEVVASWPKPNYDDPASYGPIVLVWSIITTIIIILVVGARLYTRIRLVHRPGWDDFLITVAAFLQFAVVVIVWFKEKYSANRHTWDVPRGDEVMQTLTTFIALFFQIFCGTCIKCSIIIFYNRVWPKSSNPTFFWLNNTILFVVLGYTIGFFFTWLFQCLPIDSFWKRVSVDPPYTQQYYCQDGGKILLAFNAFLVGTDVAIGLLPLAFLHRLQIRTRQKWALGGLFALVLLACICAAVRTTHVYNMFWATYDVSWERYPIWGWTIGENTLGIVCASAPALKPLFRKLRHSEVIDSIISLGRRDGSRGTHDTTDYANTQMTEEPRRSHTNSLGESYKDGSQKEGPSSGYGASNAV